jgi:cytochrome b pre-mRNA-processing protein 3
VKSGVIIYDKSYVFYHHIMVCTFPACSLPDTFQSWFLVAHLHVWLCLVRLKREGKDGAVVIREVVTAFWHDMEQRMRVSYVGMENGNWD